MKRGRTLICQHCGEPFYVRAYRSEKAKYCSRSCLAKVHLPQFAEYRWHPTGKPARRYKQISVNGKEVRLHRHLMEQHLGRKLSRDEHVHHINGDHRDNRIENLMVLSNADHQRLELIERGHTRKPLIT
jgi:hypothetical protein